MCPSFVQRAACARPSFVLCDCAVCCVYACPSFVQFVACVRVPFGQCAACTCVHRLRCVLCVCVFIFFVVCRVGRCLYRLCSVLRVCVSVSGFIRRDNVVVLGSPAENRAPIKTFKTPWLSERQELEAHRPLRYRCCWTVYCWVLLNVRSVGSNRDRVSSG